MYFLPERGVFSFFAVAVDDHAEAIYGLALFFKNRDDIDAAAAAQTHQQHLHGADAEVLAPGLGAAVHSGAVSIGVFGFKAEISFYPAEFNPDHCQFFCKSTYKPPEVTGRLRTSSCRWQERSSVR